MLYPSCFNRVTHITEIEHDQYPRTYGIVKELLPEDVYNSRFQSVVYPGGKIPSYSKSSGTYEHRNCAIHELAHLIQLYVNVPECEFIRRCKLFNMGFDSVRPKDNVAYGVQAGINEIETLIIENNLAFEFNERPLVSVFISEKARIANSISAFIGAKIAYGPKYSASSDVSVFKQATSDLLKKYKNKSISDICNNMLVLLRSQDDFVARQIQESEFSDL